MNTFGARKNLRPHGEGGHSTPLLLPHAGFEVTGCFLFNGKPTKKSWEVQPQFPFPLLPVFNTSNKHPHNREGTGFTLVENSIVTVHSPLGQVKKALSALIIPGTRKSLQLLISGWFGGQNLSTRGRRRFDQDLGVGCNVIEPTSSNKVHSAGKTNGPTLSYHILLWKQKRQQRQDVLS